MGVLGTVQQLISASAAFASAVEASEGKQDTVQKILRSANCFEEVLTSKKNNENRQGALYCW